MEKKINILGEDIVLRFNMAVQLSYEEVTGEAFIVQNITTRKAQAALYIAAIITNNPETGITLERLMKEAKSPDFQALDMAMGELISDWYNLPKAVADVIEEDSKKAEAKNTQAKKTGGRKQKH